MRLSAPLAALATAAALGLGACGGSDEATQATSSTSSSTTTTTQAEGEKVSANTASQEEIVAALEAADVDNAERWAHEVEEYRPYPEDDPNMAKLREELAKYNPGPGVTDKIVGALEP